MLEDLLNIAQNFIIAVVSVLALAVIAVEGCNENTSSTYSGAQPGPSCEYDLLNTLPPTHEQ